jgi:uncharacterized protein
MNKDGATSERSTIRRVSKNAVYDRDMINAILDEAMVCHVGFIDDGQPLVLPMLYARDGDKLYVHGSVASRAMRVLGDGTPCCIAVTLIDGLVLARSLLHHSMNYRSVVIFAKGRVIEGREAKNDVLFRLTEGLIPGRWDDARQPTDKELDATGVVEFLIEECSAKVRTGPPGDDEPDYALPYWAGVLPLKTVAGVPVADDRLREGVAVPGYVSGYSRPGWE